MSLGLGMTSPLCHPRPRAEIQSLFKIIVIIDKKTIIWHNMIPNCNLTKEEKGGEYQCKKGGYAEYVAMAMVAKK